MHWSKQYLSEACFQALFCAADAIIYALSFDGVFRLVSPAWTRLLGHEVGEVEGQSFALFVHPDDVARCGAFLEAVVATGKPQQGIEYRVRHHISGEWRWHTSVGTLVREANEAYYVGMAHDVTERRQMATERQQWQKQIIETQEAVIRELSLPLLPIAPHLLLLPLIGTMDSQRAQQMMETLLAGIGDHRAHTVILDLTGVHLVDMQVAQALVQAAQAARLLGSQIVLTGLQTQVAQTLVHLEANLDGIITRPTLQSGITLSLKGTRNAPTSRP
jgi:PAS domain S-box-containing protein